MNKTSVECFKGELNTFSEEIYKNLQVLTFLHPVTDDFNKNFCKDMFIKSNPKAFPHVMHFMFTILDPLEFKKRFYWPILDRNSENDFRSATVQYLNFLNDKYELKLETIKSYIVVMPGGFKFMKVLGEFTKLVMKEELRKRNKTDLIKSYKDSNLSIKKKMNKILKEKKLWIETTTKYKEIIEADLLKMDKKILQLNKLRGLILSGTSTTTVKNLTATIDLWKDNNNLIYEKILIENNELNEISKNIFNINEFFEKYLHQDSLKTINFNQNELINSLNIISKLHSNEYYLIQNVIKNNKINIGNLLKCIKLLMPSILKKTSLFSSLEYSSLQYELEKINKILLNVKQQQIDIVLFKQNAKEKIIARSLNNTNLNLSIENNNNNNNLKTKLISTPMLQFQLNKNLNTEFNRNNLTYLNHSNNTSNNTNNNLLKSSKKLSHHNKSIMNRLNINPLNLLRSVTKKPKQSTMETSPTIISFNTKLRLSAGIMIAPLTTNNNNGIIEKTKSPSGKLEILIKNETIKNIISHKINQFPLQKLNLDSMDDDYIENSGAYYAEDDHDDSVLFVKNKENLINDQIIHHDDRRSCNNDAADDEDLFNTSNTILADIID